MVASSVQIETLGVHARPRLPALTRAPAAPADKILETGPTVYAHERGPDVPGELLDLLLELVEILELADDEEHVHDERLGEGDHRRHGPTLAGAEGLQLTHLDQRPDVLEAVCAPHVMQERLQLLQPVTLSHAPARRRAYHRQPHRRCRSCPRATASAR